MIVFISDLHLADNARCSGLSSDAFRIFRKHVGNIAYAASFRDDTTYTPLDRMDVVLLGDVFDVITSDRWYEGDARPWDIGGSPEQKQALAARVEAITGGILDTNAASLRVLREMTVDGVTIPDALPAGAASMEDAYATGAGAQRVEVGIHYQIGNHDWFYGVDEVPYQAMRDAIRNKMGLSNPDGPFPWRPGECAQLAQLYAEHGVYASHGDEYDGFNYPGGTRSRASLGDGMVVEVVQKFRHRIECLPEGEVPREFVDGLTEIDNVRPMLHTPLWLRSLMARCAMGDQVMRKVKREWDKIARAYSRSEFVDSLDAPWEWDTADTIQSALLATRALSLDALGRLGTSALAQLVPTRPGRDDAKPCRSASDTPAKYVLFGHTHGHVVAPIAGPTTPVGPAERVYINTGTWRRTHSLVTREANDAEFAAYDVMTYVVVYKGDERKRRGFETWSGTLDMEPA